MGNLAGCYTAAARWDAALGLREEALAISRKVNGAKHVKTLLATGQLSEIYWAIGRRDAAVILREEMRMLAPQAADRVGEAIALDEPALPLLRKKYPGEYEKRIQALETLILCYNQTSRKTETGALRKELTNLRATLAKFKTAPAS